MKRKDTIEVYGHLLKGAKIRHKDTLEFMAILLLVIGGLNWGLVGLLNLDLIKILLGPVLILQQIVYILIGLAALVVVYKEFI